MALIRPGTGGKNGSADLCPSASMDKGALPAPVIIGAGNARARPAQPFNPPGQRPDAARICAQSFHDA